MTKFTKVGKKSFKVGKTPKSAAAPANDDSYNSIFEFIAVYRLDLDERIQAAGKVAFAFRNAADFALEVYYEIIKDDNFGNIRLAVTKYKEALLCAQEYFNGCRQHFRKTYPSKYNFTTLETDPFDNYIIYKELQKARDNANYINANLPKNDWGKLLSYCYVADFLECLQKIDDADIHA